MTLFWQIHPIQTHAGPASSNDEPTTDVADLEAGKCGGGMAVERRQRTDSTWIDVFDRVLDKGIVVDPGQRASLSLGGIDLRTVSMRIVVVSIETYFKIRGDPHVSVPVAGRTLDEMDGGE